MTNALVFDMPVELGLELVPVIRPHLPDAEWEAFDDVVDEGDGIGLASRRTASGTGITTAPAIIHCSCSISSAIWSAARFVPATSIAPMAGRACLIPSWRAITARSRASISAADAGFANPDVYEYLEAEGIKYAIRLPANRVLQDRIGYLLKRPVGRPPNHVRRYLRQLHLSGRKLVEAAPGRRQGRMASGRALSARRLHRHQHGAARRECRRLLQQARHVRAMDQGGQGRDQMDAAFLPLLRRQRRSPSASRARLQSRQLPAHAGDAGADQGLVDDDAEGEADQDRREGCRPRALCRVPDGGGRHSARPLRRHSAHDRGTSAAADRINA